MSSDLKHCPYCGSVVEKGAQFCQNCGASLSIDATVPAANQPTGYTPPPPAETYGTQPYYQQPTQTVYVPRQQTSDDSLGILSLIFGLLGCFVIPFIGSIVAIITGHMARKKGSSTYSTVGLLLGYISLVLSLLYIGLIIWLAVPWYWYI